MDASMAMTIVDAMDLRGRSATQQSHGNEEYFFPPVYCIMYAFQYLTQASMEGSVRKMGYETAFEEEMIFSCADRRTSACRCSAHT
jgi:hypothetical protein